MSKEETTTSSIRINPKVWKDFKTYCAKNKVGISEKLEELIKEELKKNGQNIGERRGKEKCT